MIHEHNYKSRFLGKASNMLAQQKDNTPLPPKGEFIHEIKCQSVLRLQFKVLEKCKITTLYILLGPLCPVKCDLFEWFLDFNSISTCPGLFTFLCSFLRIFFERLGFFYVETGCTQFYRILIIFNRSIWPIDGTLTGTTPLGHSVSWSNGNEGVFNHCKSFRSKTLSEDGVSCHTRNTLLGSYISARNIVSVF